MSTAQIDVGTLGLPREGTLAHDVMVELVTLAVGDLSGAQAASVAGRDFIVSALTALAACPVLRFSHKQVAKQAGVSVGSNRAAASRRPPPGSVCGCVSCR